jgi:hypothetical protein
MSTETLTAIRRIYQSYLDCDLSDRKAAKELLDRIYQFARSATVRRYDSMFWVVYDINRHRVQIRRPRGPALLLDQIAELLAAEVLAEGSAPTRV